MEASLNCCGLSHLGGLEEALVVPAGVLERQQASHAVVLAQPDRRPEYEAGQHVERLVPDREPRVRHRRHPQWSAQHTRRVVLRYPAVHSVRTRHSERV